MEVKYLFLALAVICNAWRDELNFHRPHNVGYWSLHTKDVKFLFGDSWHDMTKLQWLFLVFAIFGSNNFLVLVLACVIIWALHETFLFFIFKVKQLKSTV